MAPTNWVFMPFVARVVPAAVSQSGAGYPGPSAPAPPYP